MHNSIELMHTSKLRVFADAKLNMGSDLRDFIGGDYKVMHNTTAICGHVCIVQYRQVQIQRASSVFMPCSLYNEHCWRKSKGLLDQYMSEHVCVVRQIPYNGALIVPAN